MNLYEITQEIKDIESDMMAFAELHDGDISEFPLGAELDGLTEAKEQKIVSMALWYKNTLSDAQAIEKEVEALDKRANASFKKAERIKEYIALCLGAGNKIEDSKVILSWRKSKSVFISADVNTIPLPYVTAKTVLTPDKAIIKQQLEAGVKFAFAEIVEKQNIQIK